MDLGAGKGEKFSSQFYINVGDNPLMTRHYVHLYGMYVFGTAFIFSDDESNYLRDYVDGPIF